MADCLISPAQEIGKCILTLCLWPPIKPHFDYWWRFDNNIQELRDGVRDLDRETFDVNKKIEEAGLRIEKLRPGVEEWLKLASDKLEEGRRILQADNIPKAWNVTSRYSMGKRAKKTAEEIAEVRNNGNFNRISDPASPAATRFSSHRSTMDFESRKHIEEKIIQYLKSGSASMVGIYGMGGVGKTTMTERIGEKLKEENLFDEVVKVTVSQTIDMPKIQNEIAELLGLKFDVNSLSARADKLRTRLMDTKRKIVIFDDVWESLRFEDLGIPIESNSERCKVLLTSRSTDTCKPIKNKKVFELKSLEEDEAWNLFKDKAGDCVEDLVLHHVAKAIVGECKGLPIALVTVGLALQDETDKHVWTYSLSKLKEAKPSDLPKEITTHVYRSLELSYEMLDTDVEKMFFLMCCLFPEDYNIPLQQLTWYSMGLQLFDYISIEEATNKTHTLVSKLQSRFLLIDGYKLHVKMHDVVRDVAIYIGSKEKNGFLKSLHRTSIENSSDVNCNWISVDISNERMEVPLVSLFPKLQLLIMLKSRSSSNELSDISFEGMKDLNVLSFEGASIGSLASLEKLQTLRLFCCKVENISVIGELTSLKILSCYGCENITELPEEIGSLSRLRLLELSYCKLLQTIPFGVISSLRRLEELKMRKSFSRWEAEENGKEKRNASLTELRSLPNLSCLEIEIDDCTLSAQEICLSMNLVKYYIRIGSYQHYNFEESDCEKVMILNLPSHIGAVGKWIQMQVRNTEHLHLQGDGSVSNNFNIAEIKNLRNLSIVECSTLKKLVETKDCKFHNLKSIQIARCPKLRSLFSVSAARTSLLQLQVLFIALCESMEHVFWNENTEGCIEFPMLKELTLWYLPKLNSLFPLNSETLDHTTSLHHFVCNPKDASFCNIKSIYIFHCDNLRSLFSVSASRRCLLQLEVLQIQSCESMEQVFWNEIRDDNTDGCIDFPMLKILRLGNLPNLTAFCQGLENIIIIKFPNLTELNIEGLPKLNSVSPLNSETLHDHTTSSLHFVCNPKVEIGCLKDLAIDNMGDNIRNIWCHQISNKVFNNLEKLYIWDMNGIRSLMSTSIAKNLVSLKYLIISGCEEMVEVIERDDDDKQVVDINCLFSNLIRLCIEDLPKLKRFWQWNHALELPLLEYVIISKCPVMEAFTLGSINTPNIREINDKKIDNQKDLNDAIQHIWTESQNKDKVKNEHIDEEGTETRMKIRTRTGMKKTKTTSGLSQKQMRTTTNTKLERFL